jgi:CheY-like chemotaxis protein
MDGLFGGPPRSAETAITQREMDIAASIQAVTEEIVLRIARHAHELTGVRNLTMAGGVANNGFNAGMMVKEYHPDIIVLDVMLPDINGKEVCQRVRGDSALDDVKIICISGMVEQDKVAGAEAAPTTSYEAVRDQALSNACASC